MTENLNDGQPQDTRILSFKSKAPQAQEGMFLHYWNTLVVEMHLPNIHVSDSSYYFWAVVANNTKLEDLKAPYS